MQHRNLGTLQHVSALGLGCMGMSEFYGETYQQEAQETLHKAVELGINFFDTADIYGFGDNEILVGENLKAFRSKIMIATKCGIVRQKDDPTARGVNIQPDYIKAACEASLKRLNTDYIDLYYLHRIDPNVPIEPSIQALAELVKAGKIRYIGLSEVDADTIRKAHTVHPIAAIQTEYSLWTRHVENNILPTCRELNIGFVPYSPLGRGFLTGTIANNTNFDKTDFRQHLPRFQGENMQANLKLVEHIKQLAETKQCSPAQLALAWVLAQGEDIVPIPGTRRVKYLTENIKAIDLILTAKELETLDILSKQYAPVGSRYTETAMKGYSLEE